MLISLNSARDHSESSYSMEACGLYWSGLETLPLDAKKSTKSNNNRSHVSAYVFDLIVLPSLISHRICNARFALNQPY